MHNATLPTTAWSNVWIVKLEDLEQVVHEFPASGQERVSQDGARPRASLNVNGVGGECADANHAVKVSVAVTETSMGAFYRIAAISLLPFSSGLATHEALADEPVEGVVYSLEYSLAQGWVTAKLRPASAGPDVVAVTADDRAVALLASAMAGGETVTIYVDGATPNTITQVQWNRPRIHDTIRQ